jgi:hypothetical protein
LGVEDPDPDATLVLVATTVAVALPVDVAPPVAKVVTLVAEPALPAWACPAISQPAAAHAVRKMLCFMAR